MVPTQFLDKVNFQIQNLLPEAAGGSLREKSHLKRKGLGLWCKSYDSGEGQMENSEPAHSLLARIVNEKHCILEGWRRLVSPLKV